MGILPTVNQTHDEEIVDWLSVFDEQFSIAELGEAIDISGKESDSTVSSVIRAVKKASKKQSDESDYKFVVQIEDDIKARLDNGEIKLVTNDMGEVFAQIRNEKGRYGSKLPIKKELAEEGITTESMKAAFQMELIKEQLTAIVKAVQELEGQVSAVLQGQQNDRIGLFYSGLSLYSEARNVNDDILKKQITAQALKSLSDANAQMIQEMRSSVGYLISGQYRKSKKVTEKINEHMGSIRQCYEVVYKASFLKATIYQNAGEVQSMLSVIEQYGRFVEKMILPYAKRFSELDSKSTFFDVGLWGSVTHSIEACKELKLRAGSHSIYYLGGATNGEG